MLDPGSARTVSLSAPAHVHRAHSRGGRPQERIFHRMECGIIIGRVRFEFLQLVFHIIASNRTPVDIKTWCKVVLHLRPIVLLVNILNIVDEIEFYSTCMSSAKLLLAFALPLQ
jgi:hypothetical protein